MFGAGQPSAFLIKRLAGTEWVIQGLFRDSLKHATALPVSFHCPILMILCAYLSIEFKLKRPMQLDIVFG